MNGEPAGVRSDVRSDVRCVVWDLDGTVWPGTVLDVPGGALADVDAEVAAAMARLEGHGIVNSVASRNPPELVDAVRAHPVLGRCVAPQVGWGWKSDALAAIAHALDLPLASFVFVDDDAFERAEVATAHPSIVVLDRAGLLASLERPGFFPAVVTDDGRARVERYRQRQSRAIAAGAAVRSTEDRAAFLQACDIRVTVRPAAPGDAARLAELSVRTSQYNSSGRRYSAADVLALLARDDHEVSCFHLRDRFGDEGLVAVTVVATAEADAAGTSPGVVELLAVSCRAAGHGVLDAAVSLLRRAHGDGIVVPVRATERNAPLRVALRTCGLRAVPVATPAAADTVGGVAVVGDVTFTADSDSAGEWSLPAWLTVEHA